MEQGSLHLHRAIGQRHGTTCRRKTDGVFVPKNKLFASCDCKRSQSGWQWVVTNDIHYAYVQFRKNSFPTREEYFVVAPARVESKTRHGFAAFEAQWEPQPCPTVAANNKPQSVPHFPQGNLHETF